MKKLVYSTHNYLHHIADGMQNGKIFCIYFKIYNKADAIYKTRIEI